VREEAKEVREKRDTREREREREDAREQEDRSRSSFTLVEVACWATWLGRRMRCNLSLYQLALWLPRQNS
jgi:hypothetical protein